MNKSQTIIWQFTGQGCQFPHMGKDLINRSIKYQKAWLQCVDICQSLGVDLNFLLDCEDTSIIQQTHNSQPLIFAFQYALTAHIKDLLPRPNIVIGHSIGEFCAAVYCGLLTLENALKIIISRSSLMSALPHHETGMMAIKSNYNSVSNVIEKHPTISISTHNSPLQTVVSGPIRDLQSLQSSLKLEKIRSILLKVSHGFHSPAMNEIIPAFLAEIKKLDLSPIAKSNEIQFLSTSDCLVHDQLDEHYWADHITNPVLYWQVVEAILNSTQDVSFIEVGPSPVLTKIIKSNTHSNAMSAFSHLDLSPNSEQ